MPLSPPIAPPLSPLRRAITTQVVRLVGGDPSGSIEQSRRDLGLFGPDSVCWKVHGDLTGMMTGGIAALFLQMLHPGALAGVWDHSDFRRDMLGRLKRTAQFIAGTTYGDVAEAEALIARVQGIHDKVAGVLPDGTPYSANDPHLLTWIHVAEVSSFLAGYLTFVDPGLSGDAQDRYYAEVAEIARRLGARDVPTSRAAVAAYLEATRPALLYDHRTAEVAQALMTQPAPTPAAAPAMKLAFAAGKDLLPPWAAQMHGFRRGAADQALTRAALSAMGKTLRWGLANSAEARARRRAAELIAAQAPAGRA